MDRFDAFYHFRLLVLCIAASADFQVSACTLAFASSQASGHVLVLSSNTAKPLVKLVEQRAASY
jgi:hypothetical protein